MSILFPDLRVRNDHKKKTEIIENKLASKGILTSSETLLRRDWLGSTPPFLAMFSVPDFAVDWSVLFSFLVILTSSFMGLAKFTLSVIGAIFYVR